MMWQKERPANEKAKLTVWLFGFSLVAATLMAYQPVWHAGFVWDDHEFIRNNPVVTNADGLYRLWFTASTPDYYPLTYSLWWMESRLWANHPLNYHLVNVLLHASSALLLWRVLLRLKIPGAMLAAAIFALHPVTVESVAWISESKNTLAMFFYLGTLLCWLKFEDSGRGRWYGLALAGFVLALLSKTAVAPLPLVFLGIVWWRRGRMRWEDVRRTVPFFVMAAAWCPVTVWFQYHLAIGDTVVRTDGFWSRLAGAGWVVWFYLYKALLPLNLIFIYPRWQINARSLWSYLPLALLVGAFLLCWRWRREWGRALFFGLAYFVVMLLPVLGFFNISFMLYSLVADRWEYFAILSPIVLAANIIRRPVPAAALLLALGVLTWLQCGMYADDQTLWETTVRRNPGCSMAQVNLAMLLDAQGQHDEAILHLRTALKDKPDYDQAHYDLGSIYYHQGRLDDAIAQFRSAIAINPQYDKAFANLGMALAKQGHLDEAMDQYRQALTIAPNNPYAHNALGRALETGNKWNDAADQYSAAIAIKPDLADAHFHLAIVLGQLGKTADAIRHYHQALDLATAAGDKDFAKQIQARLPLATAHEPAHP